jgi:hypothetical protein
MSEARKPFAKVVFSESLGAHELWVGPMVVESELGFEEEWGPNQLQTRRETAATINAAVEAREGALLGEVRGLVEQWRFSHFFTTDHAAAFTAEVMKLQPDEYVSGDLACGLAFDLGMEQGRTAAFRPLLDMLLETGGQASALAFELGRALGLDMEARRWKQTAEWLSNDELRAECRRRGWHPEMGLAPRYDPPMRVPASLPNLPSELRPGEVFGIDHHGRGRPQWRDARGTWHDYSGGPAPQGAVQLRVLYGVTEPPPL